MPDELKAKLDELIKKLEETFETNEEFKQDRYNKNQYFIWESRLDYDDISDLLITDAGHCNWDNMQYVIDKGGYNIHAGERDSFGWLTGVIEKRYPNGTRKSIIYG